MGGWEGGLKKKQLLTKEGLREFTDLRGNWSKRGGDVFEGGCDTPMNAI